MLSPSLNLLSKQGLIWHGDNPTSKTLQNSVEHDNAECSSTGFKQLDALLGSKGWPSGDVMEILTPQPGIGELSLLTPWLKQASKSKKVAFINPPFIPNAKLLELRGVASRQLWLINAPNQKDTLWAQYQCLKSGLCCAVLMWSPIKADTTSTRKLQLAAKDSNTLGVSFRSEKAINQSTLFPYRIHMKPNENGVDIRFLKRRGGWETDTISIEMHTHYRRLTQPNTTTPSSNLGSDSLLTLSAI
ncbi:translesion DNA synthesis-associated protein ImuA [Marinomonas mediterranea]|uniref:translesion DNA synthesis-associated protein ImuA n=1 Tax=Marinomonas mediterranea TaxID=119864 RepID=UPI00234B4D22|nr:translesion DNA synthesis-associated protein ImuA [Marinomonas mediterranea]WCN09392.1 translesion DNA synthesis-associated protein ImuA [Marinomonas mediterranea]